MPNHIHFATTPKTEDSLAKVFRSTNMNYAQYFNKKYNRVGHVWQCRFFSCAMEETHLYSTIRYIENNPVRANLVPRAEDWKWSSAREHLTNEKGIITFMDQIELSAFINIPNWKNYLTEVENINENDRIRKHTYAEKPLGSNEFIKNLINKFGNKVLFLPRGGQKKK